MKNLLTLFAILLCVKVSAQTAVYDTTVVRTPIAVAAKSGAGQRDTIFMPSATTSVNGFMPSTAMTNIANLQTSMATANNNIATLQSNLAALGAPVASNTQTGTTYTLVPADNNRTIIITNTGAVTITLPTGLADGFRCSVFYQSTAGSLTFAAATGVTRFSAFNYTKAQYSGTVTIISLGSNRFALGGNTQR